MGVRSRALKNGSMVLGLNVLGRLYSGLGSDGWAIGYLHASCKVRPLLFACFVTLHATLGELSTVWVSLSLEFASQQQSGNEVSMLSS